MEQHQEICILLRRVVSQPKTISLLNSYCALPISYPILELSVEDDTVIVKAEQIQLLCMSRDKYTYLRNDLFPSIIKAQVLDIDYKTDQALLNNFTYHQPNINRRQQVRIEPSQPIIGIYYTNDENITTVCQIVDISLDGTCILVKEEDVFPGRLTAGMSLTIHFRLPIGKENEHQKTYDNIPYTPPLQKDYRLFHRLYIPAPLMNYPSIWGKVGISREIQSVGCVVQGIVENFTSEPELQQRRFGICLTRLYNDVSFRISQANISKYIIQRQSEIIHEIRDKYDMVSWLVTNEKAT